MDNFRRLIKSPRWLGGALALLAAATWLLLPDRRSDALEAGRLLIENGPRFVA